MKMRADPAGSTRQTLPAHITNDGGNLLLSMRSNRIRRIRTPPCAKANPLMMIYYYLALRSLPQRLPQQRQQEKENAYRVPSAPAPGIHRGKYRYRNHVPNGLLTHGN